VSISLAVGKPRADHIFFYFLSSLWRLVMLTLTLPSWISSLNSPTLLFPILSSTQGEDPSVEIWGIMDL
jgi:hypothetical protein